MSISSASSPGLGGGQGGKVPMKFRTMPNGANITSSSGATRLNSSTDRPLNSRNIDSVHADSPNQRNNELQVSSSRSLHSQDSQSDKNGEQYSPYTKFQENTLAKYKYKISTYYESNQNNPTAVAKMGSKPGILAGNENGGTIEEFQQVNEKETMDKYHQRQIKVFQSY